MEGRMKTILLWAAVIFVCFIGIPIHLRGADEESQLMIQFNNFTQQFGKHYNSEEERERGYLAFKNSIKEIHRLNKKPDDRNLLKESENGPGAGTKKWRAGLPMNEGEAVWGLTPFADMSTEEFQSQFLSPNMLHHIEKRRKSHHHHRHHQDPSQGIPFENFITRKRRNARSPKVDWRDKGIVSPVKQQKSCGACWAFATVETVESMDALANGKLQALSVQQVIDCATNGNLGCNGGDTCTAIEWMTGRQITTEQEYPTTLKTGSCLLHSTNQGVRVKSNYSCQGFVGNEDALLDVLESHGPVAVGVDASNWQYYVGGIIQWNCDANLNHAVQIVGYDISGETPHYIVRNTWGTSYGDKGYLYVATGSNLCGIAEHVAWLSVS